MEPGEELENTGPGHSSAKAPPMRAYWCGRPVESLTKEELIEALVTLAKDIEAMRVTHRRDLDFLGTLYERARR